MIRSDFQRDDCSADVIKLNATPIRLRSIQSFCFNIANQFTMRPTNTSVRNAYFFKLISSSEPQQRTARNAQQLACLSAVVYQRCHTFMVLKVITLLVSEPSLEVNILDHCSNMFRRICRWFDLA